MEESRIGQGYEVYDSNGDKVGSVGEVFDNYFRMDTGFLGLGKDFYVPFDAVSRVRGSQVILSTSKDRIDRLGWDRPPEPRRESGLGVGRERTHEEFEGRGERRMPLSEEEIEVRRHRERAGEIEVTKDVEEERRRMRIPYTEERVHVERRPVDPSRRDRPSERDESEISIPIYEEEIEVTKRPVVREEVVISKEEVTREKEIEETLRREVPLIHKEGDVEIDEDIDQNIEEERRRREERR